MAYKGHGSELYDLRRDPWEMNSLALDPRYRQLRNTLRRVLQDLRTCRGRACDKLASASVQ